MFKIKLPFYEMDGEIGSVSTETTSEASSVVTEGNIPSDTGSAPVSASETATEQLEVTQQESFAKRLNEKLAAERQKWEQEHQEKMRDYEARAQYLDRVAKYSGYSSHEEFMQAIEQAEQQRLIQEEARRLGVDESVVMEHFSPMKQQLQQQEKRSQELEQKLEQYETDKLYREFRGKLDTFASEKGVSADDLENFMLDNNLPNMEIAFKAMKFEDTQAEKDRIKKEAVKEYLESKQAPRVEGSGVPGMVKQDPPKTFEEARERTLAMFRSANNQN